MGFIFNAVKRLIKTVIKLSLFLALIATVIILIPNLPPYTKFTSIEVSPLQPRVGPLAINSALNNAERLYSGKLLGPEAFQVFKGELYTSLATGEIVKLSPEGHVTFVTTVGHPCSGITQEHICGRPLGIVIDEKDESLYVADAYHGIWKVNLKTNKKQLLVSPRVEIEKRQPKLFNCLALAKNGDFYWTDSTSDFHLKDGAMSVMTDPSGRLFHYDAAKNQSKVLLDDLWFPNGVVVSPNNDFVVVSETFRARIMKYYINGPRKGQSEVFVDGLPGVPDNSRALPDGSGVLVALYTVFEPGRPPLPQLLAAAPLARKLFARVLRLVEIPFEYLNTIYPNIIFEEIVYSIGHFKSISSLTTPLSGLLQIDWNGKIVAGYYNTDKSLGHVSDAIVFNDKLYTGSPHQQDFVGTVPAPPLLKKAFESSKKSDVKVENNEQKAKPIQQAPTQKTEEKPKAKVEEKPKVETKPKVEKSKPAEEKAKVEKEAPKAAKPVAAAPKPPQQEKPAAQPPKPAVQQPKPAAQQPKPAAPQPKPAAQQPKPDAQQPKPDAQQPKPAAQQPKPAAQQPKPAAQQPKPAAQQPKPAAQQPKPAAQQPKPAAQQPKPVAQQPKPAAQQTKPAAQQPAATKPSAEAKEAPKAPPQAPKAPQQAPKAPSPTKPAPVAVKPEVAQAPTKTEPKATAPNPEVKAPPLKKTQTETKNEAPKKAQPDAKQELPKTAEVKPKPIKEEIPSDTAKPTKETLKVIKRDGPAEIHVPNQ